MENTSKEEYAAGTVSTEKASAKKSEIEQVRELISRRRRHGDRRDGHLLRDIDSMHFIMPIIYPNRCDNEAFISDVLDVTNLNAYLEQKNANVAGSKRLSPFVAILYAAIKTIYLRPRMNRFIANNNMYQRNEISAAFTIKTHLRDDSDEGLAFIHAKDSSTINDIWEDVNRQVGLVRDSGQIDPSTQAMDFFTKKLPRFISKSIIKFVRVLDRHGKVPKSLIETDPYYSSVVLTYLGSIRMQSGYHHLTNWGTNSFFIAVGEKKLRPFYDRRGNVEMRDSIDISFIIDERLADGFYYAKTIRLFKKLIENPELLERPLFEEVRF